MPKILLFGRWLLPIKSEGRIDTSYRIIENVPVIVGNPLLSASLEAIAIADSQSSKLYLYGRHPWKEQPENNHTSAEEWSFVKVPFFLQEKDRKIRAIVLSSCLIAVLLEGGELWCWDRWHRRWNAFPHGPCQSITYSGHGPLLHIISQGK